MSADASTTSAADSRKTRVPECVFVTGPRGAAVKRWVHENIHLIMASHAAARCAVLLVEPAGMGPFAATSDRVVVRKLALPCLCCPGLADLPAAVRALVAAGGVDFVFIVTPPIVAAALLAQFDVVVRWPRRVVVCLDEAWAAARQRDGLSPFQFNLLGLADSVVPAPALDPALAKTASASRGSGSEPDAAPARAPGSPSLS